MVHKAQSLPAAVCLLHCRHRTTASIFFCNVVCSVCDVKFMLMDQSFQQRDRFLVLFVVQGVVYDDPAQRGRPPSPSIVAARGLRYHHQEDPMKAVPGVVDGQRQ